MTNMKTLDRIRKEVRIVRDRREEDLTPNTHDQVRLLITIW
jgi:hypothetical protein